MRIMGTIVILGIIAFIIVIWSIGVSRYRSCAEENGFDCSALTEQQTWKMAEMISRCDDTYCIRRVRKILCKQKEECR